jgi:hypothetical protein
MKHIILIRRVRDPLRVCRRLAVAQAGEFATPKADYPPSGVFSGSNTKYETV